MHGGTCGPPWKEWKQFVLEVSCDIACTRSTLCICRTMHLRLHGLHQWWSAVVIWFYVVVVVFVVFCRFFSVVALLSQYLECNKIYFKEWLTVIPCERCTVLAFPCCFLEQPSSQVKSIQEFSSIWKLCWFVLNNLSDRIWKQKRT